MAREKATPWGDSSILLRGIRYYALRPLQNLTIFGNTNLYASIRMLCLNIA
jgi:hypothetical protein